MIEARTGAARIVPLQAHGLEVADTIVQTSSVKHVGPESHSGMPALAKTWQTVVLSSRSLSWLVAAASVLLSLWTAYAQFIPNPDSMLYLRSAELFAAGRWH